MKKILALILLTCLPTLAQTRRVDGYIFPGVETRKNYVTNGDFELANELGVTDSSGIATHTTTTPLDGAGSLSINASATSQEVVFSTLAREPAIYGQDCKATFVYNGDASLYTVNIDQGGSALAGTTATLTNAGTSATTAVIGPFACGVAATGANTIVITATDNAAAAIKIDKMFFGLAETESNTAVTPSCTLRSVSSSDTATTADCQIHATGTYTQVLYTAVGNSGKKLSLKNAGVGNITVDGNASETIDGQLTWPVGPNQSLDIYSNGTNWFIQ